MPVRELGFWGYLGAAFTWKVPVGALGHVPLNLFLLLAFAVLGLLNPGFWLLAAGLELAYLLALAGNPRFQKLVQAMRLAQKRKGRPPTDRQLALLAALDGQSRARYQALAQTCAGILKAAEGSSSPIGGAELKSGGLNQLLWIFLKLLVSRQRIAQTLSQTSRKDIDAEIAATNERLSKESESSPLFRTLTGTLEIQKKRLDNLLKAAESLKITDAELERIEKQAALMREEVSVSSDPELLSVRLDGIVDSLQGTTKWMSEHDELFGQLDAETLTVDILGSQEK